MIAAEIGEAAGRDANAVEPVLVEPVRGRLHRQMRDAFARELVERAMQVDRIGRGQRAIDLALSAITTPMVPMLAASIAERRPDLPREGGDRGLAAGAGDRRNRAAAGADRIRAASERERAPRVVDLHEQRARRQRSAPPARPRSRPRPPSTACAAKASPSALVPGTATNRSPRLDRAAVRGDAARPRSRRVRGSARPSGRRSESFIVGAAAMRRPHPAPHRRHGCPAFAGHDNVSFAEPDLGQNQLVRRRQVEARLDAEQRRDPRDHLAGGRRRVPARGGKAVGFRQALRLVEHDQEQIARLVGRQHRHEGGEQLGLGIAAVDHLFRGAGLAADVIARDVGLAGRALLGVEPHQVAHLLAGLGLDHLLGELHRLLFACASGRSAGSACRHSSAR